jgi:hypothetical protein
MEDLTNGFSADVRQIVLAQRSAQSHQRPGARLILLMIRLTLHFSENACLLRARVDRLTTTACGNGEGEEAALVEAAHQLTDGIIVLVSCNFCRLGIGVSCTDRYQRIRSLDDIHALTGGFRELL